MYDAILTRENYTYKYCRDISKIKSDRVVEREIFIRIYEAEEFVPIYVDLKALISGTYKRSGKVAIKRQAIKNVNGRNLIGKEPI